MGNAFWEIFTLLTGILYIILEIRQRNFMWVVGVLTSLAAMWVFYSQALYASFCLNCYYLAVSFIGLWQWRRDAAIFRTQDSDGESAQAPAGESAQSSAVGSAQAPEHAIRLRPMTIRVLGISLAAFIVLTLALGFLARKLGDPMSGLDVAVAVLSAIATWWLSRSYKEQWLLWIVADAMSTVLCVSQQLWWMTALYAAYTLSAVYGYCHWKRHGREIS